MEKLHEQFWLTPLEELEKALESTSNGLTDEEAQRRLSQYGLNLPGQGKSIGELAQFLRFFGNPLVLVLLAAAVMSAAFGEQINALLITIMIFASVVLNFFQTYRSQKAAESLRHSVTLQADVIRDGNRKTIPASQVVPGDIFAVSAGDLIPADGLLLQAKDLYMDQAVLTGESLPQEKQAGLLSQDATSLDRATNAVFAGTSVVSGTAEAIAVKTGSETHFGDIAKQLSKQPPPTEFERGMNAFGYLILRIILVLVLFVFLVLSLVRHNPIESFLFSIALAVGLTPEFLPMIITVTLSSGAMRMAKQRVIVKQLQAIENFGSIDVLCSDKTGTLTEGTLVLDQALDALGHPAPEVLDAAVLNSLYESGIRSPLDEAILKAKDGIQDPKQKIDEIPFDFHRRRLSVIIMQDGHRLMVTKGAPEGILAVCDSYRLDNKIVPLDSDGHHIVLNTFQALSQEGLRALAIAQKQVQEQPAYEPIDETGLTFLGFVTFRDPPREDVAETLNALAKDGIRVVILTGDNEWVTQKICSEVGLQTKRILLGSDVDQIRMEALPSVAEEVSVYARMSPEQKTRVILALKEKGHVVGYLGDGINDAPSLRMADVGISVASAVDVAKEAAPIILLDKSLKVLHQGTLEGRRSFANVIKYIMMGTSSNFGNMFSMAGAALILPFLPMLPLQILLNNLLYDVSQLTIPGDRVEETAVLRPRRWNIRFIQEFMFYMGPVSSLFDFLTFGLLLYFFHASESLFHTGWFIESLLTQTLVIFVIRTRQSPFSSHPSKGLLTSVLAACGVGILLPYTGFGQQLGFIPLPGTLILAILAMTCAYLFLAETMKRRFYRRIDREQRD